MDEAYKAQCNPGQTGSGSMNSGLRAEPIDKWANRSTSMRCESCMFYVAKGFGTPVERWSELGRCRRHAPTLSGYPAVFSGDWCGDYKIDADKRRG